MAPERGKVVVSGSSSDSEFALHREMTAAYLASPFQKALLVQLSQMSRDEEYFFVDAPLVLDCRDDAEAFRNQLTDSQRAAIAEAHEQGGLEYVSQLARPAYTYARGKLQERYSQLDPGALRRVLSFLDDWRLEVGKPAGQPGKSRSEAFGIDIILPVTGARLSYDIPSLVGL